MVHTFCAARDLRCHKGTSTVVYGKNLFCRLAGCDADKNKTEPTVTLLVKPVLFLISQVKMPAVKRPVNKQALNRQS